MIQRASMPQILHRGLIVPQNTLFLPSHLAYVRGSR